jgi:hypothetical protein
MGGNRTPDLYYTDNLCSQPFAGSNYVGWLGTWNTNMEYNGTAENGYSGNIYNSNPDISIYKNQLECNGNSSTSGGGINPTDWAEETYEAWFDCVDDWVENGYPDDLIDCIEGTTGTSGPGNPVPHWNQYVKKMLFFKIDDDRENDGEIGNPIEYEPGKKNEFYNPNNLILDAGLYKMYAVFSSGKIIPLIFEHKAENTIIRKTSDIAELNIVPNPIENNQLKVEVKAEKKIKYKLQIHNLDGVVLYSDDSFINEGATKNVTVNVTKNKYQFNQVRVVLIFEDGSKIEKIAYRPN